VDIEYGVISYQRVNCGLLPGRCVRRKVRAGDRYVYTFCAQQADVVMEQADNIAADRKAAN